MDDILELSIAYCRTRGITIVRGPCFDNAQGVRACNWAGAVLLYYSVDDGHLRPGWLRKLCDVLGKDTYWFWRFNYGFNQGRALQIYTEEGGKRVWHTDKVSESGSDLAHRYLLYGRK